MADPRQDKPLPLMALPDSVVRPEEPQGPTEDAQFPAEVEQGDFVLPTQAPLLALGGESAAQQQAPTGTDVSAIAEVESEVSKLDPGKSEDAIELLRMIVRLLEELPGNLAAELDTLTEIG